jgi:hypothetical protein
MLREARVVACETVRRFRELDVPVGAKSTPGILESREARLNSARASLRESECPVFPQFSEKTESGSAVRNAIEPTSQLLVKKGGAASQI